MKLILVRHGQTEENKKSIWQGQSEGMLSQEGKEQVEKLTRKLGKEKIDMIYCSDMQRTKDTIKPLVETTNIPVNYAKELRERKLGVLEGATTEQINKYFAERDVDFETSNFETGETGQEMRNRIAKFYEDILKKHENDTVLFITHGGAVAQLMLYIFGYPIDRFREFIPQNTGITELEIKKGKPELLVFDNTEHL